MGDKKSGKESRCPESGREMKARKPKYGEKNGVSNR